MMNRQPKHWVLVADSGQARILELQRKPYEFRLVAELVSEAQHQTNKELKSDASGRVYSAKGAGTHAMAPRADPHDQAEDEFVRSLTQTLEKAARLGAFEHLHIIADPRTLGRLRRFMSKALAARVTEEHTMNLSGLPLGTLEPRVCAVLGWKEPKRAARPALSP
jgi:protein required for attachment to host cells